jgi:hypothetical protein
LRGVLGRGTGARTGAGASRPNVGRDGFGAGVGLASGRSSGCRKLAARRPGAFSAFVSVAAAFGDFAPAAVAESSGSAASELVVFGGFASVCGESRRSWSCRRRFVSATASRANARPSPSFVPVRRGLRRRRRDRFRAAARRASSALSSRSSGSVQGSAVRSGSPPADFAFSAGTSFRPGFDLLTTSRPCPCPMRWPHQDRRLIRPSSAGVGKSDVRLQPWQLCSQAHPSSR